MKTNKVMITGLICLTVLEITALTQGINGTLFAVVIGVIAAVLGVAAPQFPKVTT